MRSASRDYRAVARAATREGEKPEGVSEAASNKTRGQAGRLEVISSRGELAVRQGSGAGGLRTGVTAPGASRTWRGGGSGRSAFWGPHVEQGAQVGGHGAVDDHHWSFPGVIQSGGGRAGDEVRARAAESKLDAARIRREMRGGAGGNPRETLANVARDRASSVAGPMECRSSAPPVRTFSDATCAERMNEARRCGATRRRNGGCGSQVYYAGRYLNMRTFALPGVGVRRRAC